MSQDRLSKLEVQFRREARADGVRDVRNGALLMAGFIVGPAVLSVILDPGFMVAAPFPVLLGALLVLQGSWRIWKSGHISTAVSLSGKPTP